MHIFTTITIITFASLGFRAITGKGMIFYFLRQPFDKLSESSSAWNKANNQLIECQKDIDEADEVNLSTLDRSLLQFKISTLKVNMKILGKEKKHAKVILYIMKPFILCSTCMASVHTVLWYYLFDLPIDEKMIAVMLSVAFLNTLLWALVELIQKTTASK